MHDHVVDFVKFSDISVDTKQVHTVHQCLVYISLLPRKEGVEIFKKKQTNKNNPVIIPKQTAYIILFPKNYPRCHFTPNR